MRTDPEYLFNMSERVSGRIEITREAMASAANAPDQIEARVRLAKFVSETFDGVGTLLHLSGHIIGADRKSGASPFGHGSDETVAIALLLRIAAELIAVSTDLFMSGKAYAAAALIRQMVEVEYLAWAFELEIMMPNDGCAATKPKGRSFSHLRSLEKLLERDFGAKIMDTTVS